LLKAARSGALRNVNSIMTATYGEFGRRIVQSEQQGEARAEYGQQRWNSSRKTSADSSQFYESIALSQNKATMLQKAEICRTCRPRDTRKGQDSHAGKGNP